MTKKRNLIVAAAAVAGVTVVGGTAGAVIDNSGGSEPRGGSGFCAEMPDALGLYPGNPVTHMGYQVGKVDSVSPKGTGVVVGFSLDSGRAVSADVRAVTRSKSLLADRSLELVGNDPSGPPLRAGQCIAVDHSYTPKSVSEITGSAADFIEAMAPSNGPQSLQDALAGLARSLRGNGVDAATLMQHASAAMTDPDQVMGDIGSAIENMAPLTEESLRQWPGIESILDQAPAVLAVAGDSLAPSVRNVIVSVAWLVNVLNDVQRNYGDAIWPLAHGGVTDLVHVAATRSPDLAALLGSIPSVAPFLRQEAGPGGVNVAYEPPVVRAGAGAVAAAAPLLDFMPGKGNR